MTEQDFVHHFMILNPTWDIVQIKKQVRLAKSLYQQTEKELQESPAPVEQELVIRRKRRSSV